ncbi:MAG: helix-turn-helix domain-containing protein [Candidatus Omnitrophica bacterium]|nr:helix-turn-helix domain-containing protein [Candidatus Omnitrophota bacterium]
MSNEIRKRLLTIKEASEYLGISVRGLYLMVYRRQIPFVKLGGKIRFDVKKLDEWIEKNTIPSAEDLIEKKIMLK